MAMIHNRAFVTVVIGLFTAGALAFAGVGYVERSSDAALAEFMTAANVSASEPDQSNANGKTGCPVGKKKLPTQITPLP